MTVLTRALTANAAFSGASGLAFALAGARVAAVLGDVPAWSVRATGIGLLAFAAFVTTQALRPTRRGVTLIVSADAAWVLASAIALAATPAWLARDGALLVAAVAAVVAALAAAQGAGLKSV